MKRLYEESAIPAYLDSKASRFLLEGRNSYSRMGLAQSYSRMGLAQSSLLRIGGDALIFTWRGDRVNEAVAIMLKRVGFSANISGPAIEVIGVSADRIKSMMDFLGDLADGPKPTSNELLLDAKNLQREKWDWALPENLL